MDLGPAGRVAVVTGSSQGIGRATALLFGSEEGRGPRCPATASETGHWPWWTRSGTAGVTPSPPSSTLPFRRE